MRAYHGHLQQYQADVDACTLQQEPEDVPCFRYHRMCPYCKRHRLDGLIGERAKGKHRGYMYCKSCRRVLSKFYLWDTQANIIIATVVQTATASAVKWNRNFQESIRHMTGE